MLACTLRQQQDAGDNEHRDDGGCDRSAKGQSAVIDRLVEEIANGRAERSRQDERSPEQGDAGNAPPIVERGENGQSGRKHKCAAFVAEASGVGHPVSQRCSERLRESDGGPVKGFDSGPVHGLNGNRAFDEIPESKRPQQ